MKKVLLPHERIIVALDTDTANRALALVEMLSENVGGFKIGLEFITAMLVQLVTAGSETEANFQLNKVRSFFALLHDRLFWDGKFDDIPNTVGEATRALIKLRAKMFTVHASSGSKSMRKAVENKGSSLALAVGVLTSYEENDAHLTYGKPVKAAMLQFARYAVSTGFDGIITSPVELMFLREYDDEFSSLLKVATGIRPKNSSPDDQKRTMTATDAIEAGADYLVIGRPITAASDPIEEARLFVREIGDAHIKSIVDE